MAQGDFTKQEADACREALDEIIKSMPRKKFGEFVGHFNDIFLFISAAKNAAPDENKELQ